MTFLRYIFLGAVALILLFLAMANRQMVTLRMIPEDLGMDPTLQAGTSLPLFVVIFLAVALGLLIGFVWEWLREHKHRAEARAQRAQKEKLEKELAATKARAEPDDDVIAIVERKRAS